MSTKDRAKAKAYEAKGKAYEAKANLEDTVEDIADYMDDEVSSRKFGLFATLAVLSVIGIVVWLVLNSDNA